MAFKVFIYLKSTRAVPPLDIYREHSHLFTSPSLKVSFELPVKTKQQQEEQEKQYNSGPVSEFLNLLSCEVNR